MWKHRDRIMPGARAKYLLVSGWIGTSTIVLYVLMPWLLKSPRSFVAGPIVYILGTVFSLLPLWFGRQVISKAREQAGRICLTCAYDLSDRDGTVVCPECARVQNMPLARELWRRHLERGPWYDEGDRTMPSDGSVQAELQAFTTGHHGKERWTPWLMRDRIVPRAVYLWRGLASSFAILSIVCLVSGIWLAINYRNFVVRNDTMTFILTISIVIGAICAPTSLWMFRRYMAGKRAGFKAKGFACLACARAFDQRTGEKRCDECGRQEIVLYTREVWRIYFRLAFWPPDETDAGNEATERVAAQSAGATSGDGPA